MLMDVASQERREKSLCFDAGSLDWRTDGLSVCGCVYSIVWYAFLTRMLQRTKRSAMIETYDRERYSTFVHM